LLIFPTLNRDNLTVRPCATARIVDSLP